jgi:YVTN family beta-propeller protein
MHRGILIWLLALPLTAQTVRILQTNAAGDEAHLIDPATQRVVERLAGLEAVHGVGFSPDGARAYFTVEGDSTVKAVELRTGKILGSVKLSGHPNNMAVSKDGRYVFAGIAVAPGAVDVIETATMKNIRSIPIQGAVHNVYVTPDGKHLVVGSAAGSIVQVFDAATLAPAWELKMDAGVRCMAFETAADGSTARLFLQLTNVHGFAVIDFRQHKEVQRVMLPAEPVHGVARSGAPSHGLAVTPDGKTLLVDSSIAEGVFFYALPELKLLGYARTGRVPDWIAITPDSRLAYVANAGSNSVSVLDIAARKELTRIPVGEVPKRNAVVVMR